MITPEIDDEERFVETFEKHLKNGMKLIQFRSKNINIVDYIRIYSRLFDIKKMYPDVILMSNGPIEYLININIDGLHLTSHVLMKMSEKPKKAGLIFSASCHNAEQLKKAYSLGVNFVTLSPILKTKTHPDASPLGWQQFKNLIQGYSLPVFALGGLGRNNYQEALSFGAYGIAAIRSFWELP